MINGKLIRKWRRDKDITQQELSIILGVTRTYVGMIERGETNLSIKLLTKIAEIMNISVDKLLSKEAQNDKH